MKYIKYVLMFLLVYDNIGAQEMHRIDNDLNAYEMQRLIDCIEQQNELLKTQIHGSRMFYLWSMWWMIVLYYGFSDYKNYLNHCIAK